MVSKKFTNKNILINLKNSHEFQKIHQLKKYSEFAKRFAKDSDLKNFL